VPGTHEVFNQPPPFEDGAAIAERALAV